MRVIIAVLGICFSMTVSSHADTVSTQGQPSSLGPIVALGDSLTYGYGVIHIAYGPAPNYSYPWDMSRDMGIPVVNAGVSGTTAREVLNPSSEPNHPRPVNLQLSALLALHPRLMVVAFGTNEGSHGWSITSTVADFRILLGKIVAAHVPIILVGTHVNCLLCEPPPPPWGANWDAALISLSSEFHTGLVLDVEYGFSAADMDDWIHCTAAGYQTMADRIGAVVASMIDRRPSVSALPYSRAFPVSVVGG